MKGLLTVLAVAGCCATAYAGPGLVPERAAKVAGKVKHRERLNAYGMRKRIGGPFKLTRTNCERRDTVSLRVVFCTYSASALTEDEDGLHMGCDVEVKVRAHGRLLKRLTWKRRVIACARLSGTP